MGKLDAFWDWLPGLFIVGVPGPTQHTYSEPPRSIYDFSGPWPPAYIPPPRAMIGPDIGLPGPRQAVAADFGLTDEFEGWVDMSGPSPVQRRGWILAGEP